jgi:hypothetical protein
MVIKVLDEGSAIACAESEPFGGLAGFPPDGGAAKPPKLCAGS